MAYPDPELDSEKKADPDPGKKTRIRNTEFNTGKYLNFLTVYCSLYSIGIPILFFRAFFQSKKMCAVPVPVFERKKNVIGLR